MTITPFLLIVSVGVNRVTIPACMYLYGYGLMHRCMFLYVSARIYVCTLATAHVLVSYLAS
jgi:hypothetical protein